MDKPRDPYLTVIRTAIGLCVYTIAFMIAKLANDTVTIGNWITGRKED